MIGKLLEGQPKPACAMLLHEDYPTELPVFGGDAEVQPIFAISKRVSGNSSAACVQAVDLTEIPAT